MLRLTLGVLLLATVAGCAVTPAEHRYADATSPATNHCLASGTHIESRKGNCTQPGRTIDLRHGGAATAADALHGLPGVIIRR